MQRLEKLQKETKPIKSTIPSEKELEERLCRLQQSSASGSSSAQASNLPKQNECTSDDIIKKISEEIKIEEEYGDFEQDEIKKLENRLKSLQSAGKTINDKEGISIGDEKAKEVDPTEELVRKLLADAELAEKKKKIDEMDTWCCLCNNDATLKCIDCDKELYCSRCYKYLAFLCFFFVFNQFKKFYF